MENTGFNYLFEKPKNKTLKEATLAIEKALLALREVNKECDPEGNIFEANRALRQSLLYIDRQNTLLQYFGAGSRMLRLCQNYQDYADRYANKILLTYLDENEEEHCTSILKMGNDQIPVISIIALINGIAMHEGKDVHISISTKDYHEYTLDIAFKDNKNSAYLISVALVQIQKFLRAGRDCKGKQDGIHVLYLDKGPLVIDFPEWIKKGISPGASEIEVRKAMMALTRLSQNMAPLLRDKVGMPNNPAILFVLDNYSDENFNALKESILNSLKEERLSNVI